MGVVKKDALRTTILSYAGLILGYLNKGLLFIKFLSTEEIGLINLLVSLGLLFGIFSCLGMTYAVWKYFPVLRAPDRAHRGILAWALRITLLGTLFFTAVVIVLQPQIFNLYEDKSPLFVDYYYWIIAFGISSVLFNVLEFYMRSLYFNVVSVLAYEVVLRVLITVSLLALWAGWMDFRAFVLVHSVIYFVPVIVLAVFLARKRMLFVHPSHIAIPKPMRKRMLSFGLFSYLNSIGSMVVLSLDVLMITAMIGLDATGIYTTVNFLASALQVPYKSMLRVSAAIISELWSKKALQEMQQAYKTFSTVNLYIGLFMFLLIWSARAELFTFLPAEFLSGIPVFLFLMIGKLCDMYCGLNGTIFITSDKYKYDIAFTVTLIVMVIGLNLLLIPRFGISGAAIGASVAYLLYNVARVIFIYKWYRIHFFEMRQLFIFGLFAVTTAFLEYIPLPALSPVLLIGIKWMILCLAFGIPAYFTSWLPEIKDFMDKGIALVARPVRKS